MKMRGHSVDDCRQSCPDASCYPEHMPNAIDYAAKEQALRAWGLPDCLHVPIAAIDEDAIRNYIGEVVQVLSKGTRSRALLVKVDHSSLLSEKLYPIFRLKESPILHARMQVWVNVTYSAYRRAYCAAFPNEDIKGKVLSHSMNRRLATILGFQFVRVTPTSRRANSSGGFSEKWGIDLYSKPAELESHIKRGMFIRYADLTSLMLMLDISIGGGIMDIVNRSQQLVRRDVLERTED